MANLFGTKLQKQIEIILNNMISNTPAGTLLTGSPGIGKAQPLYSKVLTPIGWKTMGEIEVGDAVITQAGQTATVTGVFPQGIKDTYTITFHDGSKTEACKEHLWECYAPGNNKFSNGRKTQKYIKTTEQLKSWISTKHNLSNVKISIPLYVPNNTKLIDLPIDPYIMGMLIGDGNFGGYSPAFTSADEELVSLVKHKLPDNLQVVTSGGIEYRITNKEHSKCNPMTRTLQALGLYKKHSYDKFIPEIYLTASDSQKWDLLKGLMDTDGTASNGRPSFCTTSIQLANQVRQMVWSLGGVATMSTVHPTYTYKTVKKQGRDAYVIQIAVPNPKMLFNLTRKKEKVLEEHGDGRIQLRRRVKSIELTNTTECKCIMIDDPSHLYITDDYIVTHNTTAIEQLSKVLGIKTVVIEIPHIVEEHLINIPFITFDPTTNKSTPNSVRLDADEVKESLKKGKNYHIKLAESNLLTKMKAIKKVSDADYIKELRNSSATIQTIYKNLGGTESEIPEEIEKARKKFSCILFLDEYYRQSSTRTRNILRGLLNKNIGMDKVPDNVYIIYASNMSDINGAVEPVLSNEDWLIMEHEAPSKDEWFDWFVSKYDKNPKVELNEDVIKIFREHLEDDDISNDDRGVRVSPRRWEQLMLYINSSLPVETESEAKQLLTNVKNNFLHYQENHYSELSKKVMKLTVDAIHATSKITTKDNQTSEDTEWRDTLLSLVKAQMKLGEYRKYVPVVSGPPGIGKTSNCVKVAHNLGLAYIPIESTVLDPESVIGIPLSEEDEEGNKQTSFSEPELYQRIMSQTKNATDSLFAYWKEVHKDDPTVAEKLIKDFPKQEWKYLILFDEVNRVQSTKVFNALRRIMLEKNFGQDENGNMLKIPEGSIVIGAINPHGGGTEQMTEHFRDVIDIIPAYGSWSKVQSYLRSMDVDASPVAKEATQNIIQEFVDRFKTKKAGIPTNKQPFTLDIGQDEFYFSPREYESLYKTMAGSIDMILKKLKKNPDIFEDKIASKEYVTTAAFEAFKRSTMNSFKHKHGSLNYENIYSVLNEWFDNLNIDVFGELFVKRPKLRKNLTDVLFDYVDLSKPLSELPEDEGFLNANSSVSHAEFAESMHSVALKMIESDEAAQKYLLDKKYPILKPNIEEGTFASDTSILTNFHTNFLIAVATTMKMLELANDRVAQISSCRAKPSEIKANLSPDLISDVRAEFMENSQQATDIVNEASQ